MNYAELIQQNQQDDKNRRRKNLITLSDKQLALRAAHPMSDVRDATVAKQILRERGVQGVPK